MKLTYLLAGAALLGACGLTTVSNTLRVLQSEKIQRPFVTSTNDTLSVRYEFFKNDEGNIIHMRGYTIPEGEPIPELSRNARNSAAKEEMYGLYKRLTLDEISE